MADEEFGQRLRPRGSPGFTAAAVLTLALGLTGTMTMFTLVNGVLLRPLPVPAEHELFVGWRGLPEVGARHWPFSTEELDLMRKESRTLAGVAGVGYNDPAALALVDEGEPGLLRASRVTGDFFRVFGVAPLVGRSLGPEDDVAGAENVLVLTHGLWQSRYGASRDIVGRRVTVSGQRFTIVGVMPRDVEHPRRVEAWMTVSAMQTTTSNPTFKLAVATELELLARVHPGVTAAQARDELRPLAPAIDALRPTGDARGFVPSLLAYREFVVGDVRAAMLILFAAVGLVLLIACANVSSLLLVRGDARRSEFAVRAALGAGRGRLIRQLVVEGLVLATGATAVALVAATALLPVLLRWVPDGLPRPESVRLDARVAGASVAMALVVAVLSALLPALTSVGRQLADSLRSTGRAGAARGGQWRRGLVVGQVALAVVGVACAGLLVSSLRQLQAEAARLATDRLVHVPLTLPQAKYSDRPRLLRFVTDLAAALEADSRIAGATPVNATPFSGTGWDVPVFPAEGQSEDEAKANPPLNLKEIHPGYFSTFAVAVIRGRVFGEADHADAPAVEMLSADAAAKAWPGLDPLGRRLKMGNAASNGRWLTVVGITAPTRYRDLHTERATLYLPVLQMLGAAEHLAVRTSMPAASVRQRRREFGVRMALGAEARHVRRLVLVDGAWLVGVGIVMGLAVVVIAAQALRSLLYGVQPLDPLSLVASVIGIVVVSAAALAMPLRSAGRVAPAEVLRSE